MKATAWTIAEMLALLAFTALLPTVPVVMAARSWAKGEK